MMPKAPPLNRLISALREALSYGGEITGVRSGSDSFLHHLVRRIRETAAQRGESFEQSLSSMIRGSGGPLASLLAALASALAAENRSEIA